MQRYGASSFVLDRRDAIFLIKRKNEIKFERTWVNEAEATSSVREKETASSKLASSKRAYGRIAAETE